MEPSGANYYQFKTEPMNNFAVVAARGAQDARNILMVAPEETVFIRGLLELASECLQSFLAGFSCTATSHEVVDLRGTKEARKGTTIHPPNNHRRTGVILKKGKQQVRCLNLLRHRSRMKKL